MASIIRQRMTAELEEDFCVFLIGMRINRLWKPHKWFPVMMAMPRMLRELKADPRLGFLGGEGWFGNPSILVQYWRSFEALAAYAKSRDHQHLPAWTAFIHSVSGNGDVGFWHETYQIRAGDYECVYNNMPPFGLGKAGKLLPATRKRESAAGRMSESGRP
jgi:hypothetical protein